MKAILGSLAVAIALALASTAVAQEQPNAEEKSTEDLAKAAQNPVANLISVPFQFQSNFGVGPYHQPQGVLNIQPVIPITINDDWNLITRWITPVIAQPRLSPTNGREFGLGDLNPSFFLSPSKPSDGGIIWGVGPTLLLPTATDQNSRQPPVGRGPQRSCPDDQGPLGCRCSREQHLVLRQHRQRLKRQPNVDPALCELQFPSRMVSDIEPNRYGQLVGLGCEMDGARWRRLRPTVQGRRTPHQYPARGLLQCGNAEGWGQVAGSFPGPIIVPEIIEICSAAGSGS